MAGNNGGKITADMKRMMNSLIVKVEVIGVNTFIKRTKLAVWLIGFATKRLMGARGYKIVIVTPEQAVQEDSRIIRV